MLPMDLVVRLIVKNGAKRQTKKHYDLRQAKKRGKQFY
jgi:hypothetical protein